MEKLNRKKHWENIYQTKNLNEVSWYQPSPKTSLDFLRQLNISKTGKIIDVGGGDSFLVDHLLDMGYQDITVLDISSASLNRAKKRLGKHAEKVKWIVEDITTFKSTEQYDFWHDRATFHFLTKEKEIDKYIDSIKNYIKPTGVLVIGTFSKQGPKKCSGLEIKQYSASSMNERLKKLFKKINCITVDHHTPFGTIQNFIFCTFRKLSAS